MKKNERPIFAQNLIKARKAQNAGKGWNQTKAADLLGISRKAYSSYEEGRAVPPLNTLPTIAHVFGISNIISFLENPHFVHHHQEREFTIHYESPLEKRYASAPSKERKIVDLALGIGTEEVTC